MTDARGGYRGYIVSRPVRGTAYPQRVQNLVVRDYAARNALTFKLSITEYAMPDCYMMLEQALNELRTLDGIILFSAFCLPSNPARRAAIVERVRASGATLHAALENIIVRTAADAGDLDDLLRVSATLRGAPFAGRYEKTGESPLGSGAEAQALLTERL